jgi:hypothetical protein
VFLAGLRFCNGSTSSVQHVTSCGTLDWNGNYYSVSGTYLDTILNMEGCDSIITLHLTIHTLPVVSLVLNPDTVCNNSGPFAVTGGSPPGGIYTGPGIISGSFDPAIAGVGTHTILYVYTDTNNCSDSSTAELFVDLCTGVEDRVRLGSFGLYPNPLTGVSELRSDELLNDATVTLRNCVGQTVLEISNITGHTVSITRGNLRAGLYLLQLTQPGKGSAIRKILIRD